MCILFVHTGGPGVGGYRLILASNRDEYFTRPALKAAPWVEDISVIGGRDLEKGREGGTWLAACPTRKRVAVLLNLSGVPGKKKTLGRGFLVSNFVLGNESSNSYIDELSKNAEDYSSFNLVTIEIGEETSTVYHYSNYNNETTCYEKGLAGFSNTILDTPFKKVSEGNVRFEDIISRNCAKSSKDNLVQELLSFLKWDKTHLPDEQIDKRRIATPNINLDGLAAVCVKIPQANYGTRTHTIILVDAEGKVDFWEWTMQHEDADWAETYIQQQI